MASTAVVDFANFVPQEVRVLTEEEFYDETGIEETYRKLAAQGITRENVCILTEYSPVLTDANKQIILRRYSDKQEARKHLMNTNELIEYLVIDSYGENDLDIPVHKIVQYICGRLMHEAGINMLSDLPRLTEGCAELTPDAVYNIINTRGVERGHRLVERINNFLNFLYENGWNHLFYDDDDDAHVESNDVQQVNLTPYKGVVENSCPICFDDNTESLVSTPCNHIYHSACIEKWLKSHSNCPLCRKQF